MRTPEKFPEACMFFSSSGGDNYLKFPDNQSFKLDGTSETLLSDACAAVCHTYCIESADTRLQCPPGEFLSMLLVD
jgi:hypothetical protein